MATVARPPNPADARVPCPLCGGLVHPIAGRCKHCKQDLTAFRGARPHAAVPLPALVAPPASAPMQVAVAAAAHEASQPILPPRVTAQSVAVGEQPSMWRSWPTIVIALAIVAIVAAVAIMVYPARDKDDKRALPPPPAPERMDTSPLPSPHAQAPTAPTTPSAPDPWLDPKRPIDPDDQNPNTLGQDDDDLSSPFAHNNARRPGATLGGVTASTGVVECDDVIAAYLHYFDCDQIKAAGAVTQQQQRDALDLIVKNYANLKTAPQAMRDTAAVGCRQVLDALRQSASAMGCQI